MPDGDWNEWFRRRSAERAAEDLRRLAEARRDGARRGKEPIDLDRLESLYQPITSFGSSATRTACIQDLETRYYLHYPDLMTLEAFAEAIERADEFDGGDLGREG